MQTNNIYLLSPLNLSVKVQVKMMVLLNKNETAIVV